jgi:hypothetical protein
MAVNTALCGCQARKIFRALDEKVKVKETCNDEELSLPHLPPDVDCAAVIHRPVNIRGKFRVELSQVTLRYSYLTHAFPKVCTPNRSP